MKVSSKTRYGLKILLHIARESASGRLARGKAIAMQEDINVPYLEQIMISLKRADVVTTVRGRNGGYRLTQKADRITLLDVIRIFEENSNLVSQEIGEGDGKPAEITDQIWHEVAEVFATAAKRITLASILERANKAEPEYVI